jgi:hypothetical protein
VVVTKRVVGSWYPTDVLRVVEDFSNDINKMPKYADPVHPFNAKPRTYDKTGGFVKRHHNMTYAQLHGDSVKAMVMPGEIVIPVKYTRKVKAFLVRRKIKLPNL